MAAQPGLAQAQIEKYARAAAAERFDVAVRRLMIEMTEGQSWRFFRRPYLRSGFAAGGVTGSIADGQMASKSIFGR